MEKFKLDEETAREFGISDLGKSIRHYLCNDTIDCENSPECPEDTDGCVAWELFKLCKEFNWDFDKFVSDALAKQREDIVREIDREIIEYDKKIISSYQLLVKEGMYKIREIIKRSGK